MPLPALPLIAAGASILGSGINAYAQGRMNRKTIQYNERMYLTQRKDSLADWNMQNEYNSPSAQMARYKAAGLNPNLIYGQSNEASPVRSTQAQSWNPRAPEVDLSSVSNAILMAYDIKLKEGQIANQSAQNQNIAADTAVKHAQEANIQAQTGQTALQTQVTQFNFDVEKEIRDARIEFVRSGNRKLQADINFTLDQNQRQALLNASNLKEAVQRILTMQQQRAKTEEEKKEIQARVTNLGLDSQLKEADIRLKQMGINPQDPTWLRVGLNLLLRTGLIKPEDLKLDPVPPKPPQNKGAYRDEEYYFDY